MFWNSDTISCNVISKQTSTHFDTPQQIFLLLHTFTLFFFPILSISLTCLIVHQIISQQSLQFWTTFQHLKEKLVAYHHVNLLSAVPRQHPLLLVCHPLTPFAISEDFTAHRASPAHSLHSSSTSLREKHAAPSNTSVEISLDDNKAESGKEPLESFSLVYRQSLRQICRSHNFVNNVAF